MDDRVIQSTVDDSKPAATQGETFSVELGKFLPTTKTGDELQHDRFRKIRHSSKLITEALDAYHQGTTLAKSKILHEERARVRKEREQEMAILHRPCEIKINHLVEEKQALLKQIKDLERNNINLKLELRQLSREKDNVVSEQRAAVESSAKLRLYARLMAEKMRAYGLSVNPESGKIEEKQRPESAAPVSSALRPQSSPPTAAAPSATNNQSNVTIADAGNAAIAISNANDDDKKAELSKPDEEPDHEILEAEKAISNVDNIARITDLDIQKRKETRWLVTPSTLPKRPQTTERTRSRPHTAASRLLHNSHLHSSDHAAESFSNLPVERKFRMMHEAQEKIVSTLTELIGELCNGGQINVERLEGDRNEMSKLLEDIKRASIMTPVLHSMRHNPLTNSRPNTTSLDRPKAGNKSKLSDKVDDDVFGCEDMQLPGKSSSKIHQITIINGEQSEDDSESRPARPQTAAVGRPQTAKISTITKSAPDLSSKPRASTANPAAPRAQAQPVHLLGDNSVSIDSQTFRPWSSSKRPLKRPLKKFGAQPRADFYMDGIYRDSQQYRKMIAEDQERLKQLKGK